MASVVNDLIVASAPSVLLGAVNCCSSHKLNPAATSSRVRESSHPKSLFRRVNFFVCPSIRLLSIMWQLVVLEVQRKQNLNSGRPGGRSQSARISSEFCDGSTKEQPTTNIDRLCLPGLLVLRGPGSTSLNLSRHYLERLDVLNLDFINNTS